MYKGLQGIFFVILFLCKKQTKSLRRDPDQEKNYFMRRLIALFIIIYLIFRILTFYVFPWLVRWYLRRYKKKFYRQNPDFDRAEKRRKKQQMDIRYRKDQASTSTEELGEYIDFEEIEEDDENQHNQKKNKEKK